MSETSKAMAAVVTAALAAEGFTGVDVTATYRTGGLWTLYLDHETAETLRAAWRCARTAIFGAVDGIRLAPAKHNGYAMWHLRRSYSGEASGTKRMGLMWKATADQSSTMDQAMRLGLGMAVAA